MLNNSLVVQIKISLESSSVGVSDYLSVSSVVHGEIRRHPSSQHPQNDGLDVHQSVGRGIGHLLRDGTMKIFRVFKWHRVKGYICSYESNVGRVIDIQGPFRG